MELKLPTEPKVAMVETKAAIKPEEVTVVNNLMVDNNHHMDNQVVVIKLDHKVVPVVAEVVKLMTELFL